MSDWSKIYVKVWKFQCEMEKKKNNDENYGILKF
jgi:hypothetical protein